MRHTYLFRVVGTQPDGIKSLKLEDFYRAISPVSAAKLANNYWRLHDVKLTHFEVIMYDEPDQVGRVHPRSVTEPGAVTVLKVDGEELIPVV
jgi:hypothetical protein